MLLVRVYLALFKRNFEIWGQFRYRLTLLKFGDSLMGVHGHGERQLILTLTVSLRS